LRSLVRSLGASALTCALALGLVTWASAAPRAHAQSTGGSFGSSGFGGGASSSGSSSSSSSSGRGSSSHESRSEPTSAATYSVPSAEPGERYLRVSEPQVSDAERAAIDGTPAFTWFCASAGFLVLFGLLFGGATFVLGRDRDAAPPGAIELRQVSVAFDWSARRALQARLAELAARAGTDARGRREASREVAGLLASACGSARYGVFQTFRLGAQDAEAKLHTLAQQYRSRYRREAAGERALGGAPELRARHEEGEGLVVVTMIVGWRGSMPPLPAMMDAQSAAHALASFCGQSNAEVVALEVIWSPAVEEDRLSSAELEALYPELLRLDADPRIGRRSCGYCRAVYAAELASCPACGAPSA
jgi:uncharacterized membrane protein